MSDTPPAEHTLDDLAAALDRSVHEIRADLLRAGWRPPLEAPAHDRHADGADVRLSLLTAATHAAVRHLPASRSAVALYDAASTRGEHHGALPEQLRTPIAAVLALAAERRRVSRLNGNLGESHSMLALALAVLDLP